MKYLHLALTLTLLLATTAWAQEKATTESGKKILVFPDGTWKPDTEKPAPAGPTSVPAGSTTKLAFNHGKSALFYNPKKWKVEKEEEAGRTSLEHTEGDGYAILISERVEIPLEGLKKIALSNAKEAAPDAEIIFEDKRKVNGKDILVLKLKGTISELPFFYYGYYYSGKEGTIQALTYTAQNLFDEFKPDFEELLNGLVVNP
ncbi:MAG TPA: hypothetical protein VGM86_29730 [Thermoanaerobaculia bacterium]|jgi:hypothetical protein